MLYTKLKHKTTVIKELTDLGVISPTVMRDIEIFERFHENPELCKECRYEVLAEVYGFKDSSSIKKIVNKLSQ
ncbi:hypothetical protein [Aegicerativicinus sediminis]|uniref:hypothetical protein n=1 Tax=Aegicerativicinus sediminis TaxID=2893202 RepID=UPI001E493B6E|nr:hypothetical protein [Aegicerativicinus sediminis]